MADPAKMCRKHLLGEHVELHMFAGSLRKGLNLGGFYERGLLEPQAIGARHEELASEMERRGFNHSSPLDRAELGSLVKALDPSIQAVRVDRAKALGELKRRCPACAASFG